MFGKKKQVARNAFGSVLILAFTAVPGAFAADEKGWYLGAGYGQSEADIDKAEINRLLTVSGYTSPSTTADETDTGWKLFGGYQFTRNWGVELAYVDLGKFSTNSRGTSGGSTDVFRGEGSAKGWSVAGIGTAMVSDSFGVFGKLGAFRWDFDMKCSVATNATGTAACIAPANRSASGTDLTYGLGLKYNLTKQTSLRVEWEQFKDVGSKFNATGTSGTSQADISLISIGIQYKL